MMSRRFRLMAGVCVVAGLRLGAQSTDLGPVPAATRVSVRVHVQPSAAQVAALDQFLVDVQNATSPSYHQWLKPAEFAARFGADADALAKVQRFAEFQGLTVGAVSATSVTLSGTAMQMEAAFAPGLHAMSVGGVQAMAHTTAVSLPTALPESVLTVSGFDTMSDWSGTLADAVDADSARIVSVKVGGCFADVTPGERAAFVLEAKQAAAQGQSVLAADTCAASFPAEVTAVVSAAVKADTAVDTRPSWQWATGLPDDGLRHSPDLEATSVDALAQTLESIAASMKTENGSAARLGNVNATLYRLATIDGLYTQPDAAKAGTWEAATGLGLVSLSKLLQVFPRGSNGVFVSGSTTNYAPTHGQSTTLISTVSDISGQGGTTVPTGTITFMLKDGTTLGTATMANGTASLTTNQLPGGTDVIIPEYSGDSNYSSGQGYGLYITVLGEPAALTATVDGSVALGANSTVHVTVSSASGLGTPSGSVAITPQGVGQNPTTYTAALSGSGGTATATVNVPALQAGAISLLINCVSADLSFTCYQPIHATAVVKQASSTITFSVTPSTPVAGTTTTFVAKVVGNALAAAPAPTGSVGFYDNGALLGTVDLGTDGKATYKNSALAAIVLPKDAVAPRATAHAFTASYFGDVNYQAANAAAPSAITPTATTTALLVSPNPPVSGSATTLTANVSYTSSGTPATGTVSFYEDSTLLGTGTLNAAGTSATYTSTTISGTAAHSFYAVYAGDSNYATSQSPAVTSQANTATISTTTSVSTSATTVNAGSVVTLTGTVVPTSSSGTAPTGTVTFTSSTQGALGSAVLSGTTATLQATLTTAGAQAISATYSGDASYKASTSATAATVTVGTVVTPIALTVLPATGAMYTSPVVASVSVSGVATTTGAGPVGSVVFTITPVGGSAASATTATVPLTATTTTAGLAAYSFPAPAPGTYTVTAACTGTNFTCTTAIASASLVTVKGNTVTTVTATPANLVAGGTETLTATISPAGASATGGTFTGTVTFYNQGGVSLGMGTVTGNQATLVTSFASTTGNVITAVYSGDTNWNSSTSAALKLTMATVTTAGVLSANVGSVLQGNNVVFTVRISSVPDTNYPTPPAPSGTVTLYDQYQGQPVLLGTVTLTSAGPFVAVGSLSTTGLMHGLHTVTAYFAATTTFAAATAGPVTVNITDYSVTVTPSTLSVARGGSVSANVGIGALDGFAGTVSLACTPAPDTLTACTLTPAQVPGGGAATLTIVTTAARSRTGQSARLEWLGAGPVMAMLVWVMAPRRRRPPVLALLAVAVLTGLAGCGQGGSATGTPGQPVGGSPLGTYLFTVTTSGSEGGYTNRHTTQVSVTIQ